MEQNDKHNRSKISRFKDICFLFPPNKAIVALWVASSHTSSPVESDSNKDWCLCEENKMKPLWEAL